MLITAAFAYAPRKNRVVIQVGAAVAILAILVVIVVLRSNHLTAEFSQARASRRLAARRAAGLSQR